MMTAGAPPPATTLAAMEEMGFVITHVYGLTESYGHTIFAIGEANGIHLAETLAPN